MFDLLTITVSNCYSVNEIDSSDVGPASHTISMKASNKSARKWRCDLCIRFSQISFRITFGFLKWSELGFPRLSFFILPDFCKY
jgi:hypothetical protein